jgi:thiopeptide-type bacteriocin biosynthesis protein
VADEVFTADSRFCLAALSELGADREDRWRFALVSADRLLAAFGLAADERLALVSDFRRRIAGELGESDARDHHIARLFRDHRAELERLLADEDPDDLAPHREALASAVAPLADRLRALHAADRLAVPPAEVFRSLLHMHLNRLLVTAPRAQELVLYDFLARLHRSRLARG